MRDEPGVDSLKAVGTKGKGKGKTIAVDTVLGKQTSSDSSEDSDLSSGPSSIAVSSSVATSCTPPTSIGSVTGAFEKVSMMSPVDGKGKGKSLNLTQGEDETGRCTCGDEAIMGQSEATSTTTVNGDSKSEDGHNPTHKSNLPISGPSLLSQTAPLDLHPHRPHCSTHSNRNAESSLSPSAPLSQSPVVEPLSTSPSTSPTPMPTSILPLLSVKIADLGNATPLHKHYTEEIQTRQYRSPEAILGRSDWGATADVWSLACVVFELLTAEYLFDPQSQGELFGKDDDHCAQIIELLGKWPSEVVWGGRYSREIFDGSGKFFMGLVAFLSVSPFVLGERDGGLKFGLFLPDDSVFGFWDVKCVVCAVRMHVLCCLKLPFVAKSLLWRRARLDDARLSARMCSTHLLRYLFKKKKHFADHERASLI